MQAWLTTQPWAGIIIWSLVYMSDYYWTIASARKYKLSPHFEFESSFELTPQFEKDVNELRPVSKRHMLMLLLTDTMLVLVWALFGWIGLPQGYEFVLGAFVLMEVPVHFRHLSTYHMLKLSETRGGLDGKLHYRRWFSYNTSAFQFFCFAIFFLLTALLTWSVFFAGGFFGCLSIANNHRRKYIKLYKESPAKEVEPAG